MTDSASASAGRVFISYRREETAYPAGWLYDQLVEHFDGEVFKDIDSIELGDDWVDAITAAVASCDVMLTLIGDEWLSITDEHGQRRLDDPSDFVRLEVETALQRDVRVIPILVDGAQMPSAAELPPGLAALVRRQAMELSPARFDFDTGRLLEALDAVLAEVRSEQEQQPATSHTTGGWPPHRRFTDQRTGAKRRDGAGPTRIAATPPPDTFHGRSRRRLMLAGLGACAVIVAVLWSIALYNPGGTPGSARTGDENSGSSPDAEADDVSTRTERGSEPTMLVASFEDGKEGWRPDPDNPDIGSVKQGSDFHTDGSYSLQVDSVGLPGEGWYGANNLRLDITGKTTMKFDIMTVGSGTETAVAVQYGNDEWCQLAQPWEWVPARTDLHTVTAELETLSDCSGVEPTSTSRNTLTAVWIWFGGDGSFRLDNVRVSADS